MKWKRNLYVVHRWVGLVVGLQLLAWSIGGFMFSILDIDNVHGDFEQRIEPPAAVRIDRVAITPADAIEAGGAMSTAGAGISRVLLRERFGRTVYELFDLWGKPFGAVDASTGEFSAEVSEADVRAAALADFLPDAPIVSLERLEGDPPLEFRGGPMPVYRVTFDHPKHTSLYISPVTGKILKRRNRPWRIFDFFWMLHIMDYGQRDDFNHWLLTGASVLAILTSATGLAIWFVRWRRPGRKQTQPPGAVE